MYSWIFHIPLKKKYNLRMNKTCFLLLLLFFTAISCRNKNANKTTDWQDEISTISIIIDDQLWNGEIGDSIRNKFASPVLGLQEEEPLFTLNQFPVKLLEGFMTNTRNIIIVKKQAKSQFYIKENEFVEPQNVIHISGKTVQEIVDTLQVNASKISELIRKTEIIDIQKHLEANKIDTKLLEDQFKIDMTIPTRFKPVLDGKKFVWYKKEITSGNLSLLVYQVPIERLQDTTKIVNSIIDIRDAIGKLYIHGSKNKAKMITEPAFSPYLAKTKIGDFTAYETKGTWELDTDFMSGPFINYAILDPKNNRVLIIEGFCYAPSKEKRNLMLELEAIIKSVKFLEK
jgi:hypothetical protein